MSSYKETAEEKRWRERLEYLHNLKKVDDMLHPQKDKDDLKN